MAGRLAIQAPHLDGTEPIGVWFAAAWAVWVGIQMDGLNLDALDDAMAELEKPLEREGDGPTMETWGADEEAQARQFAFMREVMGAGLGGAADGSAFGTVGGDA